VVCYHLVPVFLLTSWWQWQIEGELCALPYPGPGQGDSFPLYLSPEDFSWLWRIK
jgi:hypothetical protein